MNLPDVSLRWREHFTRPEHKFGHCPKCGHAFASEYERTNVAHPWTAPSGRMEHYCPACCWCADSDGA